MAIDVSPRFTLSLRGYDKDEVDDYLESLNVHASEVDVALATARERAASLEAELTHLQSRMAELEAAVREDTPRTARALGERITMILTEAEEAATEAVAQAQAHADAMLDEARDEAETMRRQAAMYRAQAEEALAGAQRDAKAVTDRMEAEARTRSASITGEAEARARRRREQIEEWAQEVITRTQAEQARQVEDFTAIRRRHEADLAELVGRREEAVAAITALQAALGRAVELSAPGRPAGDLSGSARAERPAETSGQVRADRQVEAAGGEERTGADDRPAERREPQGAHPAGE